MNIVKHNGCTITIERDEFPQNPRTEWDNLGTMVCFHKRYNLGDKHGLNITSDDFANWDELEAFLHEQQGALVVLPLFLYDHSGITISTGRFSCAWDSGQVGFIFVSKGRAESECPRKEAESDAAYNDRIKDYLIGEVKTYDDYLTGEVYGYSVTDDATGTEGDSCFGFYGYEETKDGSYMMGEARSAADWLRKKCDSLAAETSLAECCP